MINMDKDTWMQRWKSLALLVTDSEDITEEISTCQLQDE